MQERLLDRDAVAEYEGVDFSWFLAILGSLSTSGYEPGLEFNWW